MKGHDSRQSIVRSTLSRSSFPRIAAVTLLAGALALLGCATTTSTGRVSFEPYGPGHVFSSVDAAAVDAMAYSVTDARRTAKERRMYGGAIRAVEGGFTYQEPTVASPIRPLDIRYTIDRMDVARFHVYPKSYDMQKSRAREHVTRWDRKSVDNADPRHRPIYFLTPSLVVKVYHGVHSSLPVQEVARLDRDNDGLSIEMLAATTMP